MVAEPAAGPPGRLESRESLFGLGPWEGPGSSGPGWLGMVGDRFWSTRCPWTDIRWKWAPRSGWEIGTSDNFHSLSVIFSSEEIQQPFKNPVYLSNGFSYMRTWIKCGIKDTVTGSREKDLSQ